MQKKQVELTEEQCQEIIEEIASTSLLKKMNGNAKEKTAQKKVNIENFSIDDIKPLPLHPVAKQAQTEVESPVAELTDEQPSTIEIAEEPLTPPIQRRVSSKQRKLSLEEYRNTFMRPYKIEDRKPVFISGKLRKMLDKFACKIGEDRMSMSGLLENIVRHHIELYADDFEHWKGM